MNRPTHRAGTILDLATLELQDTQTHIRTNTNNMTDQDLAEYLYAQELQMLEDARVAATFAGSAEQHSGTLDVYLQVAADHELALKLAANGSELPATPDNDYLNQERVPWYDQNEPEASFHDDHEDSDEYGYESAKPSSQAGTHGIAGPSSRVCTTCTDSFPAHLMLDAPCGHHYCSNCISQLFRLSMRDETLFSPRCCSQHITLDLSKSYLGPALSAEFSDKSIELSTTDRTYCHEARCATFIPPITIVGDVASCGTCGRRTCSMCKAASHHGDCPRDVALQQLTETAQAEGWRRCVCGRFIELNYGCNHMTCVCRHQFCYVCSMPWKTCGCAQWQEERLLNRAEQVVNRQPQPILQAQPLNAQAQAQAQNAHVARVGQMAAHLRQNHECQHPSRWRRFQGYHLCEVCNKEKKNTVGECKHCFLVACYHCRRHRL